jgi:hypothetical protein
MPRKFSTRICAECERAYETSSPRGTCRSCILRHRHAGRRVDIPPPNPSGLCQCGCQQPAPIARQSERARGFLLGHPLRYIPGHNGRKSPLEFVVEDRGYPGGPCHIWQRALSLEGYGKVNVNGKTRFAHRESYERTKGPIPDGLTLDHLCRQRACVNADHLEAVTQAENCRRAYRRKRANRQ